MLSDEEEQQKQPQAQTSIDELVVDIVNESVNNADHLQAISNQPPPRTKHWIHWELVNNNNNNINSFPFKTALLSVIHSSCGLWGSLLPKDILVERMTEAFSNVVLRVQQQQQQQQQDSLDTADPDDGSAIHPHALIIKIHGFTDVALKELKWLRVLSGAGQSSVHAPALLAEFGNGHIEECIDATSLTVSEMRDLKIAKEVMRAMYALHSTIADIGGDNDLYNRVERWRLKAEAVGLVEFEGVVNAEFCHKLVQECETVNSPLVMSHNDLQMGNIMRNKESGKITFVDYEYSNIAPRGFDLANYMLEWMADYSDARHRESMNRAKYPNEQERRQLLAAYLQCPGDDEQVSKLDDEIKPFLPLSHLLWTLWAIHQSSACNEIDFDYIAYARTRHAFLA